MDWNRTSWMIYFGKHVLSSLNVPDTWQACLLSELECASAEPQVVNRWCQFSCNTAPTVFVINWPMNLFAKSNMYCILSHNVIDAFGSSYGELFGRRTPHFLSQRLIYQCLCLSLFMARCVIVYVSALNSFCVLWAAAVPWLQLRVHNCLAFHKCVFPDPHSFTVGSDNAP